MQKPALWRVEWLWLGALAAPLLLGFWWIPGAQRGPTDSFSYEVSGKKAVYSLAEELFSEVYRSDQALPPFSEFTQSEPPDIDTLCILGPSRYPDAGEWHQLQEWVWQGHNLVFAAKYGDPAVEIDTFGLKVVPDDVGILQSEEEDRPSREISPAENALVGGEVDFRSHGSIDVGDEVVDVLLAINGKKHVVSMTWGSGRVVVLSSDYIFTNYALARRQNGLLAYRILEFAHGGRGTIAFDESLNASGPPKVVGLLLDPLFRPLTLQFIACGVLFGWMGSRRFGPVVRGRHTIRRSIVEHAKALGNLHFKAGTGGRSVSSYLDYFRRELRLHYVSVRQKASAVALARQTGWDEKKIVDLLHRAESVGKSDKTSSAQAAAIVRALAKLKKALDTKGSSRKEKGA